MTSEISKTRGRTFLVCLVGIGAIATFGLLFWQSRGDGMSSANRILAVRRFAEFYAPLLGVVTAFYFHDRVVGANTEGSTPLAAFALAVMLTGMWTLLPPALLLTPDPIEDVLKMIEQVAPLGQLVAPGALTYFFARAS